MDRATALLCLLDANGFGMRLPKPAERGHGTQLKPIRRGPSAETPLAAGETSGFSGPCLPCPLASRPRLGQPRFGL